MSPVWRQPSPLPTLRVFLITASIFGCVADLASVNEVMHPRNTTQARTNASDTWRITVDRNVLNGRKHNTTKGHGKVQYSGLPETSATTLMDEELLALLMAGANETALETYFKVAAWKRVNFNGLNQVLAPVTVVLPQLESIGSSDSIQVDMSQLECKQISIGAIGVETLRRSPRVVDLNASLENVAGNCQARFSFSLWGFQAGDGLVSVEFQNAEGPSSVKVRAEMESAYDYGPPTFASTPYCKPQWRLELLLFGTDMADFLNEFKELIQGAIEDQFNSLICKEMEELAPSWLTDNWLKLTSELGPYTPCSDGQNQTIVHKNTSYTQCAPSDSFVAIDPVSIEAAVAPSVAGFDLLNLMDNYIVGLTMPLQKQLGSVVSETLPNGSVRADLGINVALRKLMKGNGALALSGRFPLWGSDDDMFTTEAAVTKVTIAGLDSFENFSLALPFSNWSWGVDFSLRKIKASVEVELAMQPSKILLPADLEVSNLAVNETFTTTVEVSGLAFRMAQLLAIELASLKKLRVGQLITTPLGCGLKSVLVANVTELEVALQDLAQPSVDGVIGVGVETMINALFEALFKMLRLPTLSMLPNIVRNKARDALNDWTNGTINTWMNECVAPLPLSPSPDYFDFGDSKLVATVTSAVNTVLDPSEARIDELIGNVSSMANSASLPSEMKQLIDVGRKFLNKAGQDISKFGHDFLSSMELESNFVGIERINELIGKYTKVLNREGVMGAFELDQLLLIEKDLGDFGVVSLNVSDFRASSLDTYSEIVLSKPTSNVSSKYSFSFGNVTRNPRMQMTVVLNIDGGDLGDIKDAFIFSLSVSSLSFLLDIVTLWDQARLKTLTMDQLLTPECVIATFREGGLGINNFSLVLRDIRLGLTCTSCTTDFLRELSQAWNENDFPEFNQWLNDPNELLARIGAYLQGPQFQEAIDKHIPVFAASCAAKTQALGWSSDFNGASQEVGVGEGPGLKLSMSVGFFTGFAFFFISMCGICKAFKGCIRRDGGQQEESKDLASVASLALVNSSCVPLGCRVAVVFFLLMSLVLFFLGHLLFVLNIDARFRLFNRTVPFNGVQVNILAGIKGFFDSGAYLFCSVVTSSQLVWPYIRTLSLFALWCVPPNRLSHRKRGKAFMWLDLMHKWSLFGVLALIMFTVIMTTSISIELTFTPLAGLYCNLIGQLLCQAISRVEVYYHQKVVELSVPDPSAASAAEAKLVLPSLLGKNMHPKAAMTGWDNNVFVQVPDKCTPLGAASLHTSIPIGDSPSYSRVRLASADSSQSTHSHTQAAIAELCHPVCTPVLTLEEGEAASFNLPSAEQPQRLGLPPQCFDTSGSVADSSSSTPLDYCNVRKPIEWKSPRISLPRILQTHRHSHSPMCTAHLAKSPFHAGSGRGSGRDVTGLSLTRIWSLARSVYQHPPWYACTDVSASSSCIQADRQHSQDTVGFKRVETVTPQGLQSSHARTPNSVYQPWHSTTSTAAAESPAFFPSGTPARCDSASFTPSDWCSKQEPARFMLPGTEPPRFTPPARYNFPSDGSLTPAESAASQELGDAMPRRQLGPAVDSPQYAHVQMAIADTPTVKTTGGSNVLDAAAMNSVALSANVKLSANIKQERVQSVCSHTCELLKQRKCNVLAVLVRWLFVPASLVLGGLLPVLGSLLPATSVTHSGVVALVVVDLDKGPGMRTSSFSVLQLLLQVPGHLNVNPIGQYGIWAVTIVFGMGIIVVPVLQAVVWIIIWAFPLSLRRLQRLLKLSAALTGMSFFEIFLVSFLVTVVQLETLIFGLMTTVRNGVGDSSFARIQNLVATLDGVGAIKPTDATIFGLAADLQQGAYVLLLAAFLLRCGGIFVQSQALEIAELSSASCTLELPEHSGSQGSAC